VTHGRLVVELRMIREDEDAVGLAQKLVGQRHGLQIDVAMACRVSTPATVNPAVANATASGKPT
jgi:hypothetical protein